MKTILMLDTSIGTQNIGDNIINDSLQRNWKELYENNYIFRFPSHTPPFSWWQQRFFPKKCRFAANADYKFLCGTNALYTNMLRPIPQWNVHLWNSGIFQDTVLVGVGAGINSSSINGYTKRLYSKILNHSFIHSVRDSYTEELLIKLGYKAINTGCPTLWGFTSDFCMDIPTAKTKDVVFTLTGYEANPQNDKAMVGILQKNYRNLFFWPQTVTDIDYINELGIDNCQIVPPTLEKFDALLNTDIDYVGNRLHGGIRALQHKKRAIIIAIDYRARNMAKSFNLPVLERQDIQKDLNEMINQEFAINIKGIEHEKIEEWKSQFDF